MSKLMYKGKQELKGASISSEIGEVYEIKLESGGYMMLSKSDVTTVPDKAEKKQIKKVYKKENNTDVSEG